MTEEALRAHNDLALRLLRRGIERLHGHLSTTERLGVDDELVASLRRDAEVFPDEAKRSEERYRRQPYRQKLLYVYRRLGATLDAAARPWRADHRVRPGTYADVSEVLADLRLLQSGLRRHRGERLAAGRLGTLVRQAEIFGFHLASLDLRQHSARHAAALAEVMARYGLASAFAEEPEEERARILTAEILAGRPFAPHRLDFSPETNETLDLFRLVRRAHERTGPRAIESYVVSMTRGPSDLLSVLLHGPRRRRRRPARRRPAVRDRRRPALRDGDDGDALREPRLRPPPARPRRRPDGDARLLRLEQGRRLPDGQLGAAPRAARARRRVSARTGSSSRSSTAAAAPSAAAAARRTARSSPSPRTR